MALANIPRPKWGYIVSHLLMFGKRKEAKMAETERRKQWLKENTTHISLKLMNNTDADILKAIEGKSKQTEIKRLIRKALETEK